VLKGGIGVLAGCAGFADYAFGAEDTQLVEVVVTAEKRIGVERAAEHSVRQIRVIGRYSPCIKYAPDRIGG